MDEREMRALLANVAEDQLPPVLISIEDARGYGRKLRRRRLYFSGAAPLAAAAAVALIAGVPSVFSEGHVSRAVEQRVLAGTPTPATVPTKFNPQRPYAQFGWLPADMKSGQGNQSTQWETLNGGPLIQPVEIQLSVTSRGECELSRATISCGGTSQGAVTRAPAIHDKPAYWAQHRLWWNYGPGAWATLFADQVAPHAVPVSSKQLLRIAAGVRYGFSYPIGYGFVYHGPMPPGWTPNSDPISPDFIVVDGRPDGSDAGLGGGEDEVFFDAWPAGAGNFNRCVAGGPAGVFPMDPAKIPQHVTGHGTTALVWTLDGKSYWHQVLCAQNADGLFVVINLSFHQDRESLRTGDELGGALGVFLDLRLLGPNMTKWTTNPVPAAP